jgi:glutathione S-transferase
MRFSNDKFNFFIIDFLVCFQITIADFAVLATLSTLEILFPISRSFPCLIQWFQNMKELPYYSKANEAGTQKLKEILKSFGHFDIK